MGKVERTYKIEFYKTTQDRLSGTKTVLDNLTFQQAVEWFHVLVGNKNGPVWFLHPEGTTK